MHRGRRPHCQSCAFSSHRSHHCFLGTACGTLMQCNSTRARPCATWRSRMSPWLTRAAQRATSMTRRGSPMATCRRRRTPYATLPAPCACRLASAMRRASRETQTVCRFKWGDGRTTPEIRGSLQQEARLRPHSLRELGMRQVRRELVKAAASAPRHRQPRPPDPRHLHEPACTQCAQAP